MKTVLKMFARLDSVTRADGAPWPDDDRRHEVVGRSGLVSVGESERRYPGKRMARFGLMAWKEEGRWCGCMPDAYWRTSYGSSDTTRTGLVMRTAYSIYRFTMLSNSEVDEYLSVWGYTRERFEALLRDSGDEEGLWRYAPAELEEARRRKN